jgi:hypothetical protein
VQFDRFTSVALYALRRIRRGNTSTAMGATSQAWWGQYIYIRARRGEAGSGVSAAERERGWRA